MIIYYNIVHHMIPSRIWGRRWEIPALVPILEILAAAVGASGGQSLADGAQR